MQDATPRDDVQTIETLPSRPNEHNHPPVPSSPGIPLGVIVEGLFLLAAIGALLFLRQSPLIQTVSVVFVAIVLEAFPFMLIGSLVGGIIEVYVPRERVTALMPARGPWTVFIAAGLGVIFPVCECAVVPVVRRLLRKGVPFSAGVAYLLGGPIANPIVAVSTAVAYKFDWVVVLIRVGVGYAIAVGVGTLMGALFEGRKGLVGDLNQDDDHDHAHEHDHCDAGRGEGAGPASSRPAMALRHAAEDFLSVGRFLVIGAFLAALIQNLLTRGSLVGLTENPAMSILAMMALAVCLNLCSEADAFVAASFRTLLPMAGQMAFMTLGPILDVKLLLMYLSLFRKRAIVTLATLSALAVFVAMMILHLAMGGGAP